LFYSVLNPQPRPLYSSRLPRSLTHKSVKTLASPRRERKEAGIELTGDTSGQAASTNARHGRAMAVGEYRKERGRM